MRFNFYFYCFLWCIHEKRVEVMLARVKREWTRWSGGIWERICGFERERMCGNSVSSCSTLASVRFSASNISSDTSTPFISLPFTILSLSLSLSLSHAHTHTHTECGLKKIKKNQEFWWVTTWAAQRRTEGGYTIWLFVSSLLLYNNSV